MSQLYWHGGRLLAEGIPDEAFHPIEGDTKDACTKWRKVNKSERKAAEIGAAKFAFEDYPWLKLGNFAQSLLKLDTLTDDTIINVRAKAALYESAVRSSDYLDGKLLADAWCASFVWPKNTLYDYPITEEVFRRIERNPHGCDRAMRDQIEHLAQEYRFFHWHLAFPDVFRIPQSQSEAENTHSGWSGGFDIVLGNPPWENTELKELEWFASRVPEIAEAAGSERKRLISALSNSDPAMYGAFKEDLRQADGYAHIARNSGRYPLCGQGRVNTYALFAENDRGLLNRGGRMGVIVPSGIATDNTTKDFFASIVGANVLVSLYDFENAVGMFEGVGHGRFKFCLLTISGAPLTDDHAIDFVFFAHHVSDLSEDGRHFTLTAEDIALINPNTRTCPIFRSARDAEITKAIYRRVPVLIHEAKGENPWGASFKQGHFNMTSDSHLFRTREQLLEENWNLDRNVFGQGIDRYCPLYEAKMLHQFQHRYGDYSLRPDGSEDSELPRIPALKLDNPVYVVQPRYWVPEWEVIKASSRVPPGLARAVEDESEDRAAKVICFWLAGYALNRNRSEETTEVVEIGGRIHSFSSMCGSIKDRAGARDAEQQFRLDESEILELNGVNSFLDAAELLVRRRVPRWLLGFRDIARSTDERTAIFSVLPPVGVGHKAPLVFVNAKPDSFLAAVNSFVFDYLVRQNMGGTSLGFFILKQLAILPPSVFTPDKEALIRTRVLELTYTALDLSAFASDIGYTGMPFRWNPERRFLIRCELDALYFHLYGISRDDSSYILDTFPIVRRKDEAEQGEYRTKRTILEIYDAMSEAEQTGRPYQTRLSPPPADVTVAHRAVVEETQIPSRILVGDRALLPNDAWATPLGVAPENVSLFALIDVLRLIGGEIDPQKVRIAAILVRKPALAAAFMDDTQAKEWSRLVGLEARPIKGNVIQISHFQQGAADLPWADAISQLKGSGGLVVASGKWSAGDRLPLSSGQDWISGRANVSVQLLGAITPADAEQGVIAFIRSVEDGTARRAIS